MKDTVLVTGSNGFIGSHIICALYEAGFTVIGCGRGENKHKSFHYIRIDLGKQAIENDYGIKYIVHAASQNPYPECRFIDYFENNVITMHNMIKTAQCNHVDKFFYLTGVSEFGKVDSVLNEDSPHYDPDDYGISKLFAGKMLFDSGIPFEEYILPGVVGEGCHSPFAFKVAKQLIKNEPVKIYNSEGMFNNVLLVTDLERFLVKRMSEVEDKSDVFLLGCKEKVKMRYFVNMLNDEIKSESKIDFFANSNGGFFLDIEKAINHGFCSHSMNDIVGEICKEAKLQCIRELN